MSVRCRSCWLQQLVSESLSVRAQQNSLLINCIGRSSRSPTLLLQVWSLALEVLDSQLDIILILDSVHFCNLYVAVHSPMINHFDIHRIHYGWSRLID